MSSPGLNPPVAPTKQAEQIIDTVLANSETVTTAESCAAIAPDHQP